MPRSQATTLPELQTQIRSNLDNMRELNRQIKEHSEAVKIGKNMQFRTIALPSFTQFASVSYQQPEDRIAQKLKE